MSRCVKDTESIVGSSCTVSYTHLDEFRPTLTFNTIGRHQSKLVKTRVACNQSPWMKYMNVGDIHTVAISHGEGRFVAKDNVDVYKRQIRRRTSIIQAS